MNHSNSIAWHNAVSVVRNRSKTHKKRTNKHINRLCWGVADLIENYGVCVMRELYCVSHRTNQALTFRASACAFFYNRRRKVEYIKGNTLCSSISFAFNVWQNSDEYNEFAQHSTLSIESIKLNIYTYIFDYSLYVHRYISFVSVLFRASAFKKKAINLLPIFFPYFLNTLNHTIERFRAFSHIQNCLQLIATVLFSIRIYWIEGY